MSCKAFIAGAAGTTLSSEERAFLASERPWGLILFRRNVSDPDQVRGLVDGFRDAVGRDDAPVLIDQEGGRVQRLTLPHWPKYPAGRTYGKLAANDPLHRREIARLGARLIAHDLRALGVTVDCLPVLDVPVEGAHDVIGDRAYSHSPAEVALLGRAASEGLLAGGVLPVIKHMPGHGRAGADSHMHLPIVDAPRADLSAADFLPFRHLADMPLGMTGHIVFSDIDPKRPATTSRKVLREIVRGEIGFDGLLMTDDLSMKALGGDFGARAKAALSAGCDLVLHCNGDLAEARAVAAAVPELGGKAKRRADGALARIRHLPEPFDPVEGMARLTAALAAAA